MQTITQEELDRKPWKYVGYKDFCNFSADSDEFFAIRRFDVLHCRLLLALQDRLSRLEEELDTVDERLRDRGHEDVDNGSFRKDQPERTDLLEKIEGALHKYNSLLLQYIQLRGTQRAPSVITRNIKQWLKNFNTPIEPKEVQYLDKRDLISVSPQAKSSAQQVFEQKVGLPIVYWLREKNHTHQRRTAHDRAIYFDDHNFEIFTNLGLYIAAVTMLAAPMWILASMNDSTMKLIVITAFLFVFVTIMNWGIVAKPFEILAAAAGSPITPTAKSADCENIISWLSQAPSACFRVPPGWDLATPLWPQPPPGAKNMGLRDALLGQKSGPAFLLSNRRVIKTQVD